MIALGHRADAFLDSFYPSDGHLLCAAVLQETYAIARQIGVGEFDFLTIAEEIRLRTT